VAEEWLNKYNDDGVAAFTDLVNCILQCAGCGQLITDDDVRDAENIAGRLADLQSVYQEVVFSHAFVTRTQAERIIARNHRLPPHFQNKTVAILPRRTHQLLRKPHRQHAPK
jgi:hypothetical protein